MSRYTDIGCILIHNIYFFKTFFETSKTVLINIVTILMMSAKFANLGLLRIKVFSKIMTSYFLFMMSPMKFHQETQIIL